MLTDRRQFLAICSRFGLASTLMPGVLWAMAQDKAAVTRQMIDDAAIIADVPIPDEAKTLLAEGLNQAVKGYDAIHALHIPNNVPPALVFDPVQPGMQVAMESEKRPLQMGRAPAVGGAPHNIEDLAFDTVPQLAEYVRTRKVSSVALTEMYIARLKRYDPLLHFVITLTEDRAMAQAREADAEIARGRYRGPLHGLPWGAKDLLAVKGYPTTWGAGGFQNQRIDETATVVKRLDEAGAVLVAKLTLGELAMDDTWFGGRTRNPWKPTTGSSGSSAGSASATAAGCVAFAIGSETLGSISSPSTRCGCTGLRPTFGLVPRTGAMALSWSMDKLGPICRAVEDCAVVLHAIAGPDGHDPAQLHDAVFNWNAGYDWRALRVGYLKNEFENPVEEQQPEEAPKDESALTAGERERRAKARAQREATEARLRYDKQFHVAALDKMRSMGVNLVPVELPKLPWEAMTTMLEAEAAAAFDELTRTGRDKLLVRQDPDSWPNVFRRARFTPAVEYIQASRARTEGLWKMYDVFRNFDVLVVPTASEQLIVTNLTGHPAVILPDGFRGPDAPQPPRNIGQDNGQDDNIGGPGTPTSITFLGPLFGEQKMLALARAYQQATDFNKKHPPLPPMGSPGGGSA